MLDIIAVTGDGAIWAIDCIFYLETQVEKWVPPLVMM